MFTPWGESQSREELGDGIVMVTTASHGGIYVPPAQNALIHEAWRTVDGWYEEDCAWAIVAYHFTGLFSPEVFLQAMSTLKKLVSARA